MQPKDTIWYKIYVLDPKRGNKRFEGKFRRRFRLKYTSFLNLMNLVEEDDKYFGHWKSADATGRPSSPIELLVLGSLRCLSRRMTTFDDIEESTVISEEVHRVFFHKFINFGRHVLFPTFVAPSSNAEEIKAHIHECEKAGFHGAAWSKLLKL
mmetsp:Transcript_4557/g.6239  ORF Transcript_4557/g.6239 Transcript_4557/m.6239 type:complete len:153 (-) Transcript_4557:18-476(-)